VPSRKILDMLDIRLPANGKARGFEPPHAELNAIDRHDFGGLFPKVFDEIEKAAEDAPWNLGFELCFASKHDGRFDGARWQKVQLCENRIGV
jgi:hypothetical protein